MRKKILYTVLIVDIVVLLTIICCIGYIYRDQIPFLNRQSSHHKAQANTGSILGDTYFKIQDYQKSIYYYTYSLNKDPLTKPSRNLYKAYYLLGEDRYYNKDFTQAIRYFSDSIEYNQELYSSYYFRGRAYQSVGNLEKALLDFDKTLQLNPDLPSVYLSRGMVNIQLNHYQNAYQDIQKTVALLEDDKTSALYRESLKLLNSLKLMMENTTN